MTERQWRKVCSLDAIASLDNLFLAASKARCGKSRRADVEEWWAHRGLHVGRLREVLLAGAWQPGDTVFSRSRTKTTDDRGRAVRGPRGASRPLQPAGAGAGAAVHRPVFFLPARQGDHGGPRLLPPVDETASPSCSSVMCGSSSRTSPTRCCWRSSRARSPCPGALSLVERLIAGYQTGPEVPPPLFAGDDLTDSARRPATADRQSHQPALGQLLSGRS